MTVCLSYETIKEAGIMKIAIKKEVRIFSDATFCYPVNCVHKLQRTTGDENRSSGPEKPKNIINFLRREKMSRTFDQYLIEQLQDPDEAKAHLELAIDEFSKDGGSEAFMLTLRLVAEAQGGVSQLAKKSNLSRQNLYKILTCKTVPKFNTALAIMKGLGFKVNISRETDISKKSA